MGFDQQLVKATDLSGIEPCLFKQGDQHEQCVQKDENRSVSEKSMLFECSKHVLEVVCRCFIFIRRVTRTEIIRIHIHLLKPDGMGRGRGRGRDMERGRGRRGM